MIAAFRRVRPAHLLLFGAVLALGACDTDITGAQDDQAADTTFSLADTVFTPTDWTSATHSNDADPDFGEVFEDGVVKRLDIVINEERWSAMLADMTNLYGAFGTGGGGGLQDGDDPIFVPAEVFYNGKEWYRVGVRFKGNSSLQTSWRQGILKLSFKLDFDEFEDTYPQIDNQRFYGFKKLSLKNNFDDASLVREKVASDVFRNAGLAVSHTAFYALYVDYGDGPVYFGLYTLVEEVDDTVLDTQFGDDDGNLYKPEESGASFAEGTFSQASFVKKTNEDDSDWSDIQELFEVLHDDTRTTDAPTWRGNLETVFDTDVFLKYLAVNTVIQNWDTYGRMTQNYYLYDDPGTDLLTWIPWDNNEALQTGKQGGALSLDFSNLTGGGAWPLIEYLYADDVYRAQYEANVAEVVGGPFETSAMQATYSAYSTLLQNYAATEAAPYTFLRGSGDFTSAIAALRAHASSRAAAVNNSLSR